MIVVKMGGAQGVNLPAVCADVTSLVQQGKPVVFVHGGSNETNALSELLGVPPRMITTVTGFTSRYTDRQTLEIFAMVVNGRINTLMVEMLQKAGVNAFGLSGTDGRLLVARRKDARLREADSSRGHAAGPSPAPRFQNGDGAEIVNVYVRGIW